jgi:hypothetical protein
MHAASDSERDPADADPIPFPVGPSVAGGRPIDGPPFPAWPDAQVLPADADLGVEPRSLYAVLVLAGAMSGTGLSGLSHHCRSKAGGDTTTVLREAVRAAFAVADEVLRQAWDGPSPAPAATAAGVAS